MTEQNLPYYLTVGYRSALGPYQQEVEESARQAHFIIDHIFGDMKSYFDSRYSIWDISTAEAVQKIVLENPNVSLDVFFEKIGETTNFIDEELQRSVSLFVVESYVLRNAHVIRQTITPRLVEDRVKNILKRIYSDDEVSSMEGGIQAILKGSLYKGNRKFTQDTVLLFLWMAEICIAYRRLSASRQEEICVDAGNFKNFIVPLAGVVNDKLSNNTVSRGAEYGEFRKISRGAFDRTLLFSMFPNYFEPIDVADDKERIKNSLQDYLGEGLSKYLGEDFSVDVDRALLEIRKYIEQSDYDAADENLKHAINLVRTKDGYIHGEDRAVLYETLSDIWAGWSNKSKSKKSEPAEKRELPMGNLKILNRLNQDFISKKIYANTDEGRTWITNVLSVLENRKQIIFYGPPGTGKTFTAQVIVESYTPNDGDAGGFSHEDSYELVQFHPSYTYEDFFEGYRPASTASAPGHASGLSFTLKPGPLKRLADRARQNPDRPYFLIIDEINRGNIAKIFGELYYLLEYRDKQMQMTLQYSDEPFTLPANIFIIGTMNTVDRSIATIDVAIRRRFAFIELSPRTEPTRGVLARAKEHGAALQNELNDRLAKQGTDLAIGPSYFFNLTSQQAIEQVWNYDILPLLVDHFYGIKSADEVEEEFALKTFLQAEDEGVDNASDSHQEFGEPAETSDGENNQ